MFLSTTLDAGRLYERYGWAFWGKYYKIENFGMEIVIISEIIIIFAN